MMLRLCLSHNLVIELIAKLISSSKLPNNNDAMWSVQSYFTRLSLAVRYNGWSSARNCVRWLFKSVGNCEGALWPFTLPIPEDAFCIYAQQRLFCSQSKLGEGNVAASLPELPGRFKHTSSNLFVCKLQMYNCIAFKIIQHCSDEPCSPAKSAASPSQWYGLQHLPAVGCWANSLPYRTFFKHQKETLLQTSG